MRLVTEEEYHKLYNRTFPAPINKSSDDILKQNIPDDIKHALYMQISNEVNTKIAEALSKPLKIKIEKSSTENGEQEKKFSPAISSDVVQKNESIFENSDDDNSNDLEDHEIYDREIINCLPEKHREKAKIVLEKLRIHPELIYWDDPGKITFFGTDTISGSMVDFLSYLLRDMRWSTAPIGSNRFLLICKRVDIPTSIVRKGLRNKFNVPYSEMTNVRSNSDSVSDFTKIKQTLSNWTSLSDDEEEYESGNSEIGSSTDS